MNILRSYKRNKFFTLVNVIGLAIGLASSIMLMLFVFNELSYDRHFANSGRIVNLSTVVDMDGQVTHYSKNLRVAYTQVPQKVAGVEAAMQIFSGGIVEIKHELKRFQSRSLLYVDSEFFKVFQMKFLEGTPSTALEGNNVVVISDKQAIIIFGEVSKAMGKTIYINDKEYTVSGVVEALPSNTHFTFNLLVNMTSLDILKDLDSIEFQTYYLIKSGASVSDVRASIEKEYGNFTAPFGANHSNSKAYGSTKMVTDIHLNDSTLFFIWLLTSITLLILLFAITNFVNLFVAQGETRRNEIAIRKANGGTQFDIVRLFFSEVSAIVFASFAIGIVLTIICAPSFSKLIHRTIDLSQMLNPIFILCMVGLFAITVVLSAFYPSFYLSKFSPLDILGKRLSLSKRRLTTAIVVFQSIITIVLMSYIFIIYKQSSYLQSLPIGYNIQNIVSTPTNNKVLGSYTALKQELMDHPEVSQVSGSDHRIGGGYSGEAIATIENRNINYSVNAYRILPDLCNLIEFQLKEGTFFEKDASDGIPQIIINEATVKMLNLKAPVANQFVDYNGIDLRIVGVVKDFIYETPSIQIAPLIISNIAKAKYVYIKFHEGVSKTRAREIMKESFRKIDPEFIITPLWEDDSYQRKFKDVQTQTQVVLLGSLLSILIASLGLIAIHLYTTMRREKEIAIRRINGATTKEMFFLLTKDILKWILVAAVIAVPIAYYVCTEWLNNHAIRTNLSWITFAIPIVLQCFIAVLATSSVSIKVLMQNPVESLKNE